MKEHDIVRTKIVGFLDENGHHEPPTTIPAGTEGTIISLHPNPRNPKAATVEFLIGGYPAIMTFELVHLESVPLPARPEA